MTAPGGTSTNIADGSSQVGFQAQTVHLSYEYHVSPGDPPEKKFEIGVRLLEVDAPHHAHELINAAIRGGHTGSRVRFYWLLALLSDRSHRELSEEDKRQLHAAQRAVRDDRHDDWADGVRVILHLIEAPTVPDIEESQAIKELAELGEIQRTKIVKHLQLIIQGPNEDALWSLATTQARQDRMANNRKKRVWKFFHPVPAPPRISPPAPITTGFTARLVTASSALVALSAAVSLAWLVVQHGRLAAVLAYLIAAAGGVLSARQGVRWRSSAARLRVKDLELLDHHRSRSDQTRGGGFAKDVDKLFDRYFARYVPAGMQRSIWIRETAGLRRRLRDEVVTLYREQRIPAERVAWLIRHHVSETKSRWELGTLLAHRVELRTPFLTKLTVVAGVTAVAVGGVWVLGSAVAHAPLPAFLSTLLLIAGGLPSIRGWLRIAAERQRYAADKGEYDRRRAAANRSYQRWRAKLADKPSDREMGTWLDCDRKVLLDEAIRHYRLRARDIIAHAYLEAPADNRHKRARVINGPWRYTHYRILVFLLTADGVRQMSADLDFDTGNFHHWRRSNYRFDAVAAVNVSAPNDYPDTFELMLMNGPAISVAVAGSGAELIEYGEDPRQLSRITLDASGLMTTLHVLEGVAAEGKDWIQYEHERGQKRISSLTAAVHGLRDSSEDL
jgi:hypothetical protein